MCVISQERSESVLDSLIMETESKLFSLMDAYYHLFNNSTLSNSSAVNCLNQLVEFRRELKIAKKNLSSSKSFSSIASNIISKPGVPKSLKLVDSKPNSQLSSTSFVYEDCDMYEDDQSTLNIASNTETLAAQPVKAAFVYRTLFTHGSTPRRNSAYIHQWRKPFCFNVKFFE